MNQPTSLSPTENKGNFRSWMPSTSRIVVIVIHKGLKLKYFKFPALFEMPANIGTRLSSDYSNILSKIFTSGLSGVSDKQMGLDNNLKIFRVLLMVIASEQLNTLGTSLLVSLMLL